MGNTLIPVQLQASFKKDFLPLPYRRSRHSIVDSMHVDCSTFTSKLLYFIRLSRHSMIVRSHVLHNGKEVCPCKNNGNMFVHKSLEHIYHQDTAEHCHSHI